MTNVVPEVAQSTETKRAETAANRFYDMAENARAEEEKYPPEERYKEEVFSGAGRETAQGNFSGAQRILEGGTKWDDDIRSVASEINQLDQEKRGEKPVSFEDAQKAISGYARGLEEARTLGGPEPDLKGAAMIDGIVSDTSRPGVEGINKALKYIEGALKSHANLADLQSKGTEKEFTKDWQERRAIRDALYREKQKRMEQGQQSQRGTEKLVKGRGGTAKRLENMFGRAAIPEDTPSRKQFLEGVQNMSGEELRLLDAELDKVMAEFGRSQQNSDLLSARLQEMSLLSWGREAVERRQRIEDQKKIEEIRKRVGLEGIKEEAPKKVEGERTATGALTEEEIEKRRKSIEDLTSKWEARAPESSSGGATKTLEQGRISENPVYEKITAENFERYRQQYKEVFLNGKTLRDISSVDSDGNVYATQDITIAEALQLAEKAMRGEAGTPSIIDTPVVKERGKIFAQGDLFRGGQWVVEKPPRSPQNPERQKEVDEVKALQARIVSKEFAKGTQDEESLLTDVFYREFQRLDRERKDYESSMGKI